MPLLRPFLRRRSKYRTSFRAPLRALLFFGQADSAVWILVDIAPLFHFSRQLQESPAGGMAQIKRRGDFTEALRLAGTGQLGKDIGFGNGCAGLTRAWHGPAHCMRSARKR
jgi:hypothetical protein